MKTGLETWAGLVDHDLKWYDSEKVLPDISMWIGWEASQIEIIKDNKKQYGISGKSEYAL